MCELRMIQVLFVDFFSPQICLLQQVIHTYQLMNLNVFKMCEMHNISEECM